MTMNEKKEEIDNEWMKCATKVLNPPTESKHFWPWKLENQATKY
jgi:hypothetical protein